MNNELLSSIVEELALEIVLIDHTEIEEMGDIITLFTLISDWATDNSHPPLFNAVEACSDLLKKLIDQSAPSPEESFSLITRTLSEIQSHARNEFDFQSMVLPPELFTKYDALEKSKAPADKNTEETDNKPAMVGLRHPTSLPGHLDNDLFTEFLGMQPENLDKMEALILTIEEQNDEASIIELKRMIHTVKGEAGFLNLDEIEALCHLTEDILGEASPSKHTDIFLNTIDWIRKAFAWYAGGIVNPGSSAPLIETIKGFNEKKERVDTNRSEETTVGIRKIEKEIIDTLDQNLTDFSHNSELYTTFISRINNSIDASKKHISKLLPFTENRQKKETRPSVKFQKGILKLQYYITKISAVADFISLNEIVLLTKNTHALLDKMLLDTAYCSPENVKLIQQAFDALKKQTACLETALSNNKKIDYDNELPGCIAKLQSSSSDSYTNDKKTIKSKKRQTAPVSTRIKPAEPHQDKKKTVAPSPDVSPDIKTTKPPQDIQDVISKGKKSQIQIRESINVDAERLDRIIDMIGELVIAESMVLQAKEIKNIESQELHRHLNQMDKITRSLQETGLSLRMLPIKSTFQKMARIARDTAKKSGKDVKFIMQGEETELDKTVVDKIGDPLLHMVRNAIDHGIEATSEERRKINKPDYGTVTIKAFHKGGNIHIEIGDDGKGLNRKAIINKAMERNLIQEEGILSDQEIYNLIFESGFSTATEITDLSGRGVGMNVVKNSIEALHGQVEIKSKEGAGSVFTIKIPLTLAIIDGMVVRVQDERYIIPTLSIITSSKLDKNEVTSIFEREEMVDIQGQLVPLFLLAKLFNTTCTEKVSSQSLMVVIEEDGKQAAIVVDELLGKQQIVIKTLGESLKNIPGVSGGAIMPDGRVGLIIDVAGVVRLAHNDQTPMRNQLI